MHFVVRPFYNNASLLMILAFAAVVVISGILMRVTGDRENDSYFLEVSEDALNCSSVNATVEPRKKPRRKEYLYRLLTNTTRSLIQMEIKARRLEENMRRIKEKTMNLLWKNKDKALWRILFKNISRHITIRHEFHQHSGLDRILHDRHATYRRRDDRDDNVD